MVIDFCQRNLLKIKPMKKLDLFKINELTEAKPIILTLESNHKNELCEMVSGKSFIVKYYFTGRSFFRLFLLKNRLTENYGLRL